MKVDLIKKYKWYIFGAIAVVLIISIGLSFCAWDNTSLKDLSINGKVAEYRYLPAWTNKVVGEDFIDNNEVRWLVVDKKVSDGKTEMVLMTYYVTEQRVYETSYTNADYNNTKNNIREYLNNEWYSNIDDEIKKYVAPKLTAYQEGTYFQKHNTNVPSYSAVAPTSNYAWLASGNEVGIFGNPWVTQEFTHDSKFEYFSRADIPFKDNGINDIGAHDKRIATTSSGEKVLWWTRTGKLSHNVITITKKGGLDNTPLHWVTASNWLRPCVQVIF